MKFDITKMNKVGAMNLGGIDKSIGLVILIVIVGALAPSMFNTNWSAITGAPTWLATLMPIIIAVGVFYIIYKAVK